MRWSNHSTDSLEMCKILIVSGTAMVTPISVTWPSSEMDDAEYSQKLVESAGSSSALVAELETVDLSGRLVKLKLPCYFVTAGTNTLTPFFTGRIDTINKLSEALLPPNDTGARFKLRSFTLCGIGGLGKTQLTLKFVLDI